MNKKSRIYTKTGDDGTTGLLGGSRVKKYDIRLEAYGTIDELNANLGMIRSYKLPRDINNLLIRVQRTLFNIGSRLASDKTGESFSAPLSINNENISDIENAIDKLEKELPPLDHFIIPGGDQATACCHMARTVCRRAERRIIEFAEREKVQKEILIYINRLSDFLFVLARKLSDINGVKEMGWSGNEK